MRKTANDVDIYWEDTPSEGPFNLIVYCPQEPCPMPTILLDSTLKEPVLLATVLSKLSRVLPFFEDDSDIGTKISMVDNNILIRFNDFHPISSGNHWLFGYPIVREVIEGVLDKWDIGEVMIVTSSIYSEPIFTPSPPSAPAIETKTLSDGLDGYVLPLFAHVSAYLCSLRDIDPTFLFFKATPKTILSMPMFSDGVGVFTILGLDIDLQKAGDLYDEYESEVTTMLDAMFDVPLNKDSEVMFQ